MGDRGMGNGEEPPIPHSLLGARLLSCCSFNLHSLHSGSLSVVRCLLQLTTDKKTLSKYAS
jgi:hypothetical protein